MANQEEDATDLNFPKESLPLSLLGGGEHCSSVGLRCGWCQRKLEPPYVECDECGHVLRVLDDKIKTTPVLLCCSCFAKGVQFDRHKNTHSFVVVKNSFELLDPKWKASEELRFLDGLRVCGVGSWEAIRRYLNTNKSAFDCKEHFSRYYVVDKNNCESESDSVSLPYIDGTDDPPRPSLRDSACTALAGYNAARSDFITEHDNNAESMMLDLDTNVLYEDDGDNLQEELVYTVAECYRSRILERERRKKIIRRHGLISQNKSFIQFNRARTSLPPQLGELFPKLHQLLSFNKLNWLVEGFRLESELRERAATLKLYRHNGLTRLCSASVYEDLEKQRIGQQKEKRASLVEGTGDTVNQNRQYTSQQLLLTANPIYKRPALPLNIVGRPGYERLDEKEKIIASEIRLVPMDFLRFKEMLMSECKKLNGLKLAQARPLIKIDVNKTRRIYDLLLSRNEIFVNN